MQASSLSQAGLDRLLPGLPGRRVIRHLDEVVASGRAITVRDLLLSGSGWGFGMAVTVAPDDVSPVPRPLRLGRRLRHDVVQRPAPAADRRGQVADHRFLVNGGLAEFGTLAAQA